MTKERPILFSAPMVRAILGNRKTMTRRIVKPQPNVNESFSHQYPPDGPRTSYGYTCWYPNELHKTSRHYGSMKHFLAGFPQDFCLYGKPGDRLWVRESFYQFGHWESVPGVKTKTGRMKWKFVPDSPSTVFDPEQLGGSVIRKGRHHKDPETRAWHKRIGRFMPRKVSRITLEITDVRVQRLQEISEEDAIAEGVERWVVGDGWREYGLSKEDESVCGPPMPTARDSFRTLWESINGSGNWDVNPFVWAISFRRIEPIKRAA